MTLIAGRALRITNNLVGVLFVDHQSEGRVVLRVKFAQNEVFSHCCVWWYDIDRRCVEA